MSAFLCVNIDHVATVRQARMGNDPDPVWAASEAQLGGAQGITMHLREDRRHIQDHDVQRIRNMCQVRLNLEMAATEEMVAFACRVKPHLAMLVPEGRQEITTEGGLDVKSQVPHLKQVIARLHEAGVRVSAFVDAQVDQIQAAGEVGFDACEIHTGPYAHAFEAHGRNICSPQVQTQLAQVKIGGKHIQELGMQFNAGHALNYFNVMPIAALPGLSELHIGHAIVSRALFIGLRSAVALMKQQITEAVSAGSVHSA